MQGAEALAARANAAVAAALAHDEQRRPAEAVASYRWARALLTKAAAAAPAGSRLAITMAERMKNVDCRLAALSGGRAGGVSAAAAVAAAAAVQRRPSQGTVVPYRQPPPPPQRMQSAPARLRADPALVAAVEAEIMEAGVAVSWDDVAGCGAVKDALQELLIRPTQRPDLYTGIRAPARGLMLFGPPGTGKTLCAKAAATECSAGAGGQRVTFFSVSASTFASKWHGEGEKLMRALFEVARARAPALLFFDEVDALLSARGGSGEHEASRRLKTEFLTQVDGAGRDTDEAVFVMAATNRPQDLDDAVLRRLSKRIYVPLPPPAARSALLRKLTIDSEASKGVKWSVTAGELASVARRMEFMSGSDIHALVREASLMPLRELSSSLISSVDAAKVRGVALRDFERALAQVKPSVSKAQLAELERWDAEFGFGGGRKASGSGTDVAGPSGDKTAGSARNMFRAAAARPARRKKKP
jgi:spastin